MLADEVKIAELRESQRHNRAQEEQARRDESAKVYGDTIKSISSLAGKENDFIWYVAEGLDIEALANLDWDYTMSDNDESDGISFSNSGIMVIKYLPTIGPVNGNTRTAVEEATTVLWQAMRGPNTGSVPYTESDIPKLIMDIDGKISFLGIHIRALGLAAWYDGINDSRNGRKVLKALGFNYDSIINDKANIRAALNSCIRELSKYPLPKDLGLIARHAWLTINIFSDTDVGKDRLYIFDPYAIPVFRNDHASIEYYYDVLPTSVGPTSSSPAPIRSSTADGITTAWSKLMYTLTSSQGLKTMISDMRKAIGSNMDLPFNYLNEDFVIVPAYEEEVLNQIHHLNLVGVIRTSKIFWNNTIGNELVLGYHIESDGKLHFGYQPTGTAENPQIWESDSARLVCDMLIPEPVIPSQGGDGLPGFGRFSEGTRNLLYCENGMSLHARMLICDGLNTIHTRLSSTHNNMLPSEVVVATRGTVLYNRGMHRLITPSASSGFQVSVPNGLSYEQYVAYLDPEGYGTEIFMYAYMPKLNAAGDKFFIEKGDDVALCSDMIDEFIVLSASDATLKLSIVSDVSKFDWHMKMFFDNLEYLVYQEQLSESQDPHNIIIWESDNVAFIAPKYLRRMHNYAVKGEFSINVAFTSIKPKGKLWDNNKKPEPQPGANDK